MEVPQVSRCSLAARLLRLLTVGAEKRRASFAGQGLRHNVSRMRGCEANHGVVAQGASVEVGSIGGLPPLQDAREQEAESQDQTERGCRVEWLPADGWQNGYPLRYMRRVQGLQGMFGPHSKADHLGRVGRGKDDVTGLGAEHLPTVGGRE